VAVIGGGGAGLTAAHELAERGFGVTVYERRALGGKARSMGVPRTGAVGRADLPAEHGFRAVFSFYRNLPDTMRRIPFAGNAEGVAGNLVSVSTRSSRVPEGRTSPRRSRCRRLAAYGDGRARESFSTIISDWGAPGMLFGKPAWSLTREQVVAEVWAQCKAHLNDTGRAQLTDEMVVSAFVDPGIRWPRARGGADRIAVNDDPLLINTPGRGTTAPARAPACRTWSSPATTCATR
jgi:hypothetical protein